MDWQLVQRWVMWWEPVLAWVREMRWETRTALSWASLWERKWVSVRVQMWVNQWG